MAVATQIPNKTKESAAGQKVRFSPPKRCGVLNDAESAECTPRGRIAPLLRPRELPAMRSILEPTVDTIYGPLAYRILGHAAVIVEAVVTTKSGRGATHAWAAGGVDLPFPPVSCSGRAIVRAQVPVREAAVLVPPHKVRFVVASADASRRVDLARTTGSFNRIVAQLVSSARVAVKVRARQILDPIAEASRMAGQSPTSRGEIADHPQTRGHTSGGSSLDEIAAIECPATIPTHRKDHTSRRT